MRWTWIALLAAATASLGCSDLLGGSGEKYDGSHVGAGTGPAVAEGGDPADGGTVGGAPSREGESAAWLVWTETGRTLRTDWVDGTGASSATREELVVAGGSGLWAWRPQPALVNACPCPEPGSGDWVEPSGACPSVAAGEGLSLVDIATGRAFVVLPRDLVPVTGEKTIGVELVGTVGPFVLLTTSEYAYSCGAHGAAGMGFVSWDTERGMPVDVLSMGEREALVAAHDTEAREAIAAGSEGTLTTEELGTPMLTIVRPSYRGGRLSVEYQFTADTCYACSDGSWSSYTRSTWIAGKTLPGAFAAWVEAPEPVKTFLGTQKKGSRHGWSPVADPSLLDTFRSAPIPTAEASGPRGPSGLYTSAIGGISLAVADENAIALYSATWPSGADVHLCDCELSGTLSAGAIAFEGGGTLKIQADGTLALEGSPDCCGAGFPGDVLEWQGTLPHYRVTAEKSFFHDARDAATVRKGFVVAGDEVEALPPQPEDEFVFAIYRGEKSDTAGWLKKATIAEARR